MKNQKQWSFKSIKAKLISPSIWLLSSSIRIFIDLLFYFPNSLLNIIILYYSVKKIRSTSKDDLTAQQSRLIDRIRSARKPSSHVEENSIVFNDNHESFVEAEDVSERIIFNKNMLSKIHKNCDFQEEIRVLNVLGHLHWKSERYADAEQYWQQSKKIAQQINNIIAIAEANNCIGTVYVIRSSFLQAIECFEQSIAIAREAGENRIELSALINLGVTYFKQSQYPKAIDCFEQSIAIARKDENHVMEQRAKEALLDMARKGYIRIDAKKMSSYLLK